MNVDEIIESINHRHAMNLLDEQLRRNIALAVEVRDQGGLDLLSDNTKEIDEYSTSLAGGTARDSGTAPNRERSESAGAGGLPS